jgi:hypothetical protein
MNSAHCFWQNRQTQLSGATGMAPLQPPLLLLLPA